MSRQPIKALIEQAAQLLHRHEVADPEGDAYRLMAHALETDLAGLMGRLGDPATRAEAARFAAAIEKRGKRMPVAQIVGRRAFWTHDFRVTDAVLDPRPDTETLVEEALKQDWERVLDLGTGSGCILLSLLSERPDASGMGVDCSAEALEVAALNAREMGLSPRAQLLVSDWFEKVEGRFDLIVSNPPYITAAAYDALQPEVKDFEPRLALSPGGDGLAAYRVITQKAGAHLTPNGHLMFEIGHDQAAAVSVLLGEAGYSEIEVVRDINGKDRVVRAVLR